MFIRLISMEDYFPLRPEDDGRCKCDFSQPRSLDELLPNSEELQAAGICPWCGFLDRED